MIAVAIFCFLGTIFGLISAQNEGVDKNMFL
jgi:hypothetical protein